LTPKTEVRFASGYHRFAPAPDYATPEGLTHRFAVIQETYRPDKVDMYFDETLWRRILAFAAAYASDGTVTFAPTEKGPELPADRFLCDWDAQAPDDRDPPAIMVREGGRRVLAIVPEYWNQIGGPDLYHDSYTYSFYAAEDLSDRVRSFLAEAPEVGGWDLSGEVHAESPVPFEKRPIRHRLARLLGLD
jgi:hypothetical protein